MNLRARNLAGIRPGPTTVALHVTDDEGKVLADVPNAGRDDYRLIVSLPSGPVIVDLYEHYQRFVDSGGKTAYRGEDAACNTYVKFGNCIQDKCDLHILIQPSP